MAAGMGIFAGIQAVGALVQGQATSASLTQQANLNIANAQEAEAQGQFDATKSAIQSGKAIGTETANYGASGVTSNSGSVLSVLSASAANAERDRLNILHGADIKAINYENQASLERSGATSAQIGSIFGAVGAVGAGATKYGANTTGSSPAPVTSTIGTSTPSSAGAYSLGNYNFNESMGP